MRSTVLPALLLAGALAPAASATDFAQLSPAQWRHDLSVLADGLPHLHPNPFHAVTESTWKAAIADLGAAVPQLTPNQILLRLMAIVAKIGEGHTSLNPLYRPELKFHYLPIRAELFADGLYVRKADPALAALVGAKILTIGRLPAEQAVELVSSVVSHDNASGAKNATPLFLVMPEVLNGLGIAEDPAAIPFGLEKDGHVWAVTLHPAGVFEPHGHGAIGKALPSDGWVDSRPATAALPLYLRQPSKLYWSEYLPESKIFYLQYNAVQDEHGEPIESFFPRVIAEAERSEASKLVIDVRANGGGNSFLNRPIVKSLVRSRFDVRGHLFVIIGRGTFSAAQNFVNDVSYWTNALFVGEPTASNPNQYGDHAELLLPESGLVVMVSTLFHQSTGRPQDRRSATLPDLPAELSFAQYRQGLDPALTAVLSYQSISELLALALRRGDPAEVTRLYRAFKTGRDTAAIPTEVEVNALGYRLLEDHRTSLAILLFQFNTESYPQSSNAYDSLGEAYLNSGDHPRAIESYRRSLALNPHNDNARRMLRELNPMTRR
ncbi:MAG TPA: tetratricopeptide repeat protein [Thermoanaerobaculia bacterium]|nr:tetratricopeptide repeat protein [Thermoanaerobaculia bacterium]